MPLAVWLHTAVRGVVCIICIMAAAECSANTYETIVTFVRGYISQTDGLANIEAYAHAQ